MSGQGPVNPPMVHPGAVAAERVAEVPVRAQDLVIKLRAGQQVQAAICAAVADAGCDAAWVDVTGLVCAPFAYVMPAASPDGARVAWYSDTYRPDGPVRVSVGGISVGRLGQGILPIVTGCGHFRAVLRWGICWRPIARWPNL